MAIIVAEALLSISVDVLISKVTPEVINFLRIQKLDVSQLEKLKITLLCLQAVLNDAEEKQITNYAVKKWLDMLRDAVFEAGDMFDEINTEALQCKVNAQYESQVWNIPSFSGFKQPHGQFNSKMQTLFEKLEHFAQKGHTLGLKINNLFSLKTDGLTSVSHGTLTSSVVNESSIVGRENDRDELKKLLLEIASNSQEKRIGVISIQSMGGLGKTTLAKLLYNDPVVKDAKFDLKGWAHISNDFDIVKVTKTLLESLETLNNDNTDSPYPESINSLRNQSTPQVQLQKTFK